MTFLITPNTVSTRRLAFAVGRASAQRHVVHRITRGTQRLWGEPLNAHSYLAVEKVLEACLQDLEAVAYS